jgi:Rv2632c-like
MDATTTGTTIAGHRAAHPHDALFNARAEIARQLGRLMPHLDARRVDQDMPLRQALDLGLEGIAPLLAAIAEDTGIVVDAEDCPPGTTLDELAHLLVARRDHPHWRIDIAFSRESPTRLTARARLTAGLDHLVGSGVAAKNPADPNVADVAAEVAAARAVADLSQQLLVLADARIAEWDDRAAPLTA